MKNGNFRPVEFWKESIMTLPDSAFFELLRTVFGKIKTPFNKQILMGDLEKFLSRIDIKKNIAGYIDHSDRRIITAIAALNEPASGELETFFSGELSYAGLHDSVVNLEERFIVYRFFEKGKSRLALNPVLKSILLPFITDMSLLFPSVRVENVHQSETSQFDDRILAALLSFVAHNREFYRSTGAVRQKVHNYAKTAFPDLPLETIIGSLRILGLFYERDENLLPDYHRFSAFGSLSRQERMEYCAAGIFCYWDSSLSRDGVPPKGDAPDGDPFSVSPWMLREKVRNYAALIHRFISLLDTKTLYPITTLQRFLVILDRDGAAANGGRIIDAMEKAGLFASETNQYWLALPDADPSEERVSIAMDTPFTMMVYPEIAYNDAIGIAAVSQIITAGLSVRFEINRDSAVLAFNRGITAEATIELLQRLSHNRIGENLIFALHDWEKRHSEVVLRKGLVLTLSPERRYLAETKPLSTLIKETIAPGVYLLPETAESRAGDALHKAGVDIIARRTESQAEDGDRSANWFSRSNFPSLQAEVSHTAQNQHPALPAKSDAAADSSAPTLINDFYSILDRMDLGPEERSELASRIDRRLVLCESQLTDAFIRYEKLEARGMDYAGKALIAKQAIAMQSPVEVIWPGRQKQEHIFGIPKAMEKTGGESILIIEPSSDQGNTIRLPLGKISLLRRIKKSIFETTI